MPILLDDVKQQNKSFDDCDRRYCLICLGIMVACFVLGILIGMKVEL